MTITIQHARSIAEKYQRDTGNARFEAGEVERPGYWFFPIGFIGSSGIAVSKFDGSVSVLGSAYDRELMFWVHENNLTEGVELLISAVHDMDRTADLLVRMGGTTSRKFRRDLARTKERLAQLPTSLFVGVVWSWARRLKEAKEKRWFEFSIRIADESST